MRTDRLHEERKLRRRKRRRRRILFLFLFLVFLIPLYIYVQYQQGLSSVKEDIKEKKTYEFYGEREQGGGIHILLIGSDSQGEEIARSDTIMIAQYHPQKHAYKLVSIMRDTYVEIPGYGHNKINAAFAFGGPELLRQTIKDNFHIDAQYYAIVDFAGFIKLIDEAFPQGVRIDVEKEMNEYINVPLKPGPQYLNGEELLGYVRFRHDAMGDFDRVKRQQKALREAAEQFVSLQTFAKLPKLIGVMKPYVNTNLEASDLIYIGKDYFLRSNNREIATLRIPVDGLFYPERISGVGEVLKADLEANAQAANEFLKQ